jgi:nucleoside-diphosphate-sugar epimerase
MPHLFCLGFGFSARALARLLEPRGWRVTGTAREPRDGTLVRFDREHPLSVGALTGVTHLLSSVPPDATGDPALAAARAAILAARGNLVWVGYLSTTGVYGDTGGAWVDESTPPAPSSDRARRRVEAEAAWFALLRDHAIPVHAFRLAGIYGPGRSALDEVRAGAAKRIDRPGQLFSRIHVEDIARTLAASIARPDPGTIYNVCDDEPAAPADVVRFACELLKVPPPPLVSLADAKLSPMGASFWADNRRVKNERIKRELGVALAYPNYREGLLAVLAAGG